MMSHLLAADLWLFKLINGTCINPVLDWTMPFISSEGLIKWLLLALGLYLLLWGGFKGRVYVLLALACVAIGDPLITNFVKKEVARPRPYQELDGVRRIKWQGVNGPQPVVEFRKREKFDSMPSAHVANNTSLVLVAFLVYGWRRWRWLWLLPLLMMFSRVYTGDHYPLDTVAGFLLGGAYTLLICCIANIVWQKCAPRLATKLYGKHSSLFEAGRAS